MRLFLPQKPIAGIGEADRLSDHRAQRLPIRTAGHQQLPEREFGEKLVHDEHTYSWSGPNCRKMMQAIYILAF